MKTMYSIMAAALLTAMPVFAQGADAWQALRDGLLEQGYGLEQLDSMLDASSMRGLKAAEVSRLLEPVREGLQERLPVNGLCERIDEGLVKGVDLGRIESAVEFRLECLRQARRLLAEVQTGRPGGGPMIGPPHLLPNLGLALESGVPAEVLKSVFLRPGRQRYGRLAHVVEAAEALHLAGLADDQLQRIMMDFMDRDMNRNEMVRVVTLLQQGLAQGREFGPLYAAVWGVEDDISD